MPQTCLCIDLRSAAQRLTQAYDQALLPAGITVTQFSQLHLIRTLEGPTLTQLSDASQLDRSTLGRNIRVLEKQGLVRTQPGADARTRTVHLTSEGDRTFQRAVPLWYGAQSELLNRLGNDGRNQLDDLLTTLTAPLSANQDTTQAPSL